MNIGLGVNSCKATNEYDYILSKYPSLFTRVGLLKDRVVKLQIDPNDAPVSQPYRRIPFGLRSKVEQKLDELVKQYIIEKVEEASEWISPVVIAPKGDNDIRLCLDMRQANSAIIRERHSLPTVDEILHSLSKSNLFSKVDLKWGFHQLKLDPSSRPITTFVTHCGLYRYKRLLFEVNAAPEIYQYGIWKVVQELEGVANMCDDIIIHGPNKAEHDRRLENLLERLAL